MATRPWYATPPFPWERPEAQELKKLLMKAYPNATAAGSIGAQAGVDLGQVDLQGAPSALWHSLLEAAASQGKIEPLLDAILADGSIAGYHDSIQDALRGAEAQPHSIEDNLTEPHGKKGRIYGRVPVSIGTDFVGRDAILEQIHGYLSEDPKKPVVISAVTAFGGVGKTRVAAEYAQLDTTREFFEGGIFWLDAEDSSSRDLQFYELTKALVPEVPAFEILVQQERDFSLLLCEALSQTPECRTLWVLDNLPETSASQRPEDFLNWCPIVKDVNRVGAVGLLLTSRQKQAGGHHVDLNVLDEGPAIALLTRDWNVHVEEEDLKALVAWVGYLPLALELLNQAVVGGFTVEELKQAMARSNEVEILDEIHEELGSHLPEGVVRGISRAFRVSEEALSQDAHRLVNFLAHYGPEPIPKELLEALGDAYNPRWIRELKRRNMLQGSDEPEIHRVLGAFFRKRQEERQKEKGQTENGERRAYDVGARSALLSLMEPDDCRNPEHWERVGKLLPHAKAMFARCQKPQDGDELEVGIRVGILFHSQGRFREAKEVEERAVSLGTKFLGQEHPLTLTSMSNLASTYRGLGDLEGAKELQERVYEVFRRLLGEEHPDTLTSMGNLGLTYWKLGDLEGAKELQERAYEVRRRVLGEEHPDTLTSMGNLGLTYGGLGDLEGAKELQERVYEGRRRVLGEEHPSTLTSMGNLGLTYWNLGDLEGAKELHERVYKVRCRVLGEKHPSTLTSMGNLAGTYWNLGDLEGAKELEEQVYEVSRRLLGEEHPSTLASMNNLSFTYRNLGRLQESLVLSQAAYEGACRTLGPTHPNTQVFLRNLRELEKLAE